MSPKQVHIRVLSGLFFGAGIAGILIGLFYDVVGQDNSLFFVTHIGEQAKAFFFMIGIAMMVSWINHILPLFRVVNIAEQYPPEYQADMRRCWLIEGVKGVFALQMMLMVNTKYLADQIQNHWTGSGLSIIVVDIITVLVLMFFNSLVERSLLAQPREGVERGQ